MLTFNLLELSCSLSDLFDSNESISSMKITDGWYTAATVNKARNSFSPSPHHLDVNVDALMLKNLEFDCDAMHLPIMVLPVPGGPNNNIPLAGLRSPVNISGLSWGITTVS